MTFDLVIPTLNRPVDLHRCLEAVCQETLLPGNIYVIDQSDGAESQKVCRAFTEPLKDRGCALRWIHQDEKSLVKARNRGIDEAKAEILCFIDDDVAPAADCFKVLIKAFEDPGVGGANGNLTNGIENHSFKWAVRKCLLRFFLLNHFDGRMTFSGFGYPVYEREVQKSLAVDFLQGSLMAYLRSLLAKERFDEWFSGYSFREDAELSYRISKLSKNMIIPGAKYSHYPSTVGRSDIEKLRRMQFKNYYYVFKKHKKKGPFSEFFFYYSLSGLILLDIIEFFAHCFKQDKRAVVGADLKAFQSLRAG